MDPDPLYDDPRLAQFYDLDNGWRPDMEACRTLADGEGRTAILDLGCGTGRLAAALAQTPGRQVVGADPAAAMLAIARARPGGERVEWVEADARTLRLGRRFDLILLTGHAFQVFLTAEDRLAALRTIAAHLAPGGRFVFDSRSPARAEWRDWTPDRSRWTLDHPALGAVEAWNDVAQDPATGIVAYGTHYRIVGTGEVLSARSRIAFPEREEIAALIARAGLRVERWRGDWSGAPWTPAAPEIVPLGTLADG